MNTFAFAGSPAERVLAAAKGEFHRTMMECEPLGSLAVAHLIKGGYELPEFNMEPYHYVPEDNRYSGLGVILSFSRTARVEPVEEMGFVVKELDRIRVGELGDGHLSIHPLVEDLQAHMPDVADPEAAALLIGGAFSKAYTTLRRTEIPGDQLMIDPLTGWFGLESKLAGRMYSS